VAAATNADRTILYVNGEAVAEGIGGDLMPNNGNLLIGAALGGADEISDCLAGAICEVAVMRRFATEEEIHAIYTAGSPAIR
jgi:hypothetical protein